MASRRDHNTRVTKTDMKCSTPMHPASFITAAELRTEDAGERGTGCIRCDEPFDQGAVEKALRTQKALLPSVDAEFLSGSVLGSQGQSAMTNYVQNRVYCTDHFQNETGPRKPIPLFPFFPSINAECPAFVSADGR